MLNERRKKRLVALALCAGFLMGSLWTAGLVYGQAPFTGSALKPIIPQEVARPIPRGLNVPNLYHPGNRFETPRLDVERLMEEDAAEKKQGPLRMGVVQEFELKTQDSGQWADLEGEGKLWAVAIHAPGAKGIRLRIRPWSPPVDAELVIYDASNPSYSFGPFNRSDGKPNEFWTLTVYSEEVKVEYYLPPGINHLAPEAQITIDGLLNQYRGLETEEELSCHLDVTCYPEWDNEKNGVGALSYVANQYGFFCSGGMLNRIPSDLTPFFMTARHCGVTPANVASLLVTWFYQTPTCNGTPPNPNTLPQTPGVGHFVDDPGTDFTLVGLSNTGAGGVYYLGWNAGYWESFFTNPFGAGAVGIHHPTGSWKRISAGIKMSDVTSCVGGASYYVGWGTGNGLTEPGSSGSPIFDTNHMVRGTLSCGFASCTEDSHTTYGRLDLAWGKLQPFLNPTDPIYVNGSFTGTELGTVDNPFNTVLEGVFAVGSGGNLYIEQGTYNERRVFDKPMTIHSRNGTVIIQ